MIKDEYLTRLRKTIEEHDLCNWLDKCEWLTGYLGDPLSPVWFVGENPSNRGVKRIAAKRIDGRKLEESENLQWNCYASETKMFREALTKAGLKNGDLCANSGWKCYITNAVKTPEVVKHRNARTSKQRMLREDAKVWWPVFQYQIDNGKPLVLVPIGKNSADIIKYMQEFGLKTSAEIIPPIYHYSYIMLRHDTKAKLRRGHPARIEEFEKRILVIARQYGCHAASNPR